MRDFDFDHFFTMMAYIFSHNYMYLRGFESSTPLERCVVILPNSGVAKEN